MKRLEGAPVLPYAAAPAMPAPSAPMPKYVTPACLAAVMLGALIAFSPGLSNEFVHWDDMGNYVDNPNIRGFSSRQLKWMATSNLLGVWQPLTWFLTAVEYRLCGAPDQNTQPGRAVFRRGIHAGSMALHAAASVLCYFVLRRLIALGAREAAARHPIGLNAGAAAGALIFAVHPLRVEVVAWASGQPYVFAMVPALACVWAYLVAQERRSWAWHGAAVLFLTASLLCKAMAAPLVAVLCVLDVYPLRRFGGAAGWPTGEVVRAVIEKIPYGVVTLGAAAATIWATASTKQYAPDPLIEKYLVMSFCMLLYVGMTFIPLGIAPYYMRPTPFNPADSTYLLAGAAFAGITIGTILFRRRAPWLLAAWACYVLVLLPVVGLVQHGGQMGADRYSYLSCIGWAALAGAAVLRAWRRFVDTSPTAAGAALALAAAVAAGLGITTAAYCRTWRDTVSLWQAMIDRNPKFHMGYYNLGAAYKRNGDIPRAIATYEKALELYPLYPEANVNLANIYYRITKDYDRAVRHYLQALKGSPRFHMAHMNLADVLLEMGRRDEAIEHLRTALEDAKQDPEAAGRVPEIERKLKKLEAKEQE